MFSVTVRDGRRVGRPHLVVHVRREPAVLRAETNVSGSGGASAPVHGAVARGRSARVGLIVSKAVGSAVVRHRVSRRLRAVMAPLVPLLPSGVAVVLRALPAAATASSAELTADVRSALRRLDVLDQRR